MSAKSLTILAFCVVLLVLAAPASRGAEIANAFLPEHIEAPDGKVTLYADYGSIGTDGRVPVYLVNRSSEPLALVGASRYLKLEYLDIAGNWVRAQRHYGPGCFGYSRSELRPGYHRLLSGYQPINGTPRTIRYKLYSPDVGVASNIGHGVVSETMVIRAASDDMALRAATFEHVLRVARGETLDGILPDEALHLQANAVVALVSERFDPKDTREALLRIRDESGPELRAFTERALRWLDGRR